MSSGELLKEFDARGDHRKSGDAPTSSRREVAEAAGMSKDQQATAVRVANVPADEFERQQAATEAGTAIPVSHYRTFKMQPKTVKSTIKS
ncbi:hypothetical protein CO655_24960 [Rhizobium sp. M1]|nr:hypothetical protein CO655_24960 [Rhizobium sp. M1]